VKPLLEKLKVDSDLDVQFFAAEALDGEKLVLYFVLHLFGLLFFFIFSTHFYDHSLSVSLSFV
jgi:hypothetical protein